MIIGIDHVVILVHDLATASSDYRSLGFTVTPGGDHADGATHNALIVFADGTYLELLAFKRKAPEHRWWRHAASGEGLIDWALLPDAIAEDIALARQQGVTLDGPIAGGRLRPDGQQIAWEMGIPHTPDLPFLCGDVTPRHLRVPEGDMRMHPNGVMGIGGITIAVNDIHASLPRYRALIDIQQSQNKTIQQAPHPTLLIPEPGAHIAMLPVGQATVTLAEPARMPSPGSPPAPGAATRPSESSQETPLSSIHRPLRHHLETRGEGPFALRLFGGEQQTGLPGPALTHGVRLELG
jgi:catechol 2,3-dioxygenase-like lactoylglutathione lyase family enzyme